jgi:hypothetical protein
MRANSFRLLVLGLAAIGIVSLGAWAGQKNDDPVPPAARAALQKLAGDAKISKIGVEREHGVLLYEAEWEKDGREVEAEVTADGDLVELEEEMSMRDLPPAVRKAVEGRFTGASKVEVEKKIVVVYEIEGKVGDKEIELMVFPTGEIHEDDEEDREQQKAEHDDKDSHEHDHEDEYYVYYVMCGPRRHRLKQPGVGMVRRRVTQRFITIG